MQKKNFKPKEDKVKHGLMIRAKISHFLAWECEGFTVEKERKEEEKKRRRKMKKEEENKKKIQVWNISFLWNSCLELLYMLYGTYVWICWLENHHNSFFVYVWVRKTLTLQYMCILVGSSQFCGWF